MTTTAMASGIDRLERLFSARKSKESSGSRPPRSSVLLSYRKSSLFSFSSNTVSVPVSSSTPHILPSSPSSSSLDDMHFPSPSFIRPKASRMRPRDDLAPIGEANPRKNSVRIASTSTSYVQRAAPTSPASSPRSNNVGNTSPAKSPVGIRPPRSPPLPLPSPSRHPDNTAATTATSPAPASQCISPPLQRPDESLTPLATAHASSHPQLTPSKVQQASLQLQLQLGQTADTVSRPLPEETVTAATSANTTTSTAGSDDETLSTESVGSPCAPVASTDNDSLAKSSSQATLVPSRDTASPKTDTEPKVTAEVLTTKAPVPSPIVLPQKSAAEETCPAASFYYQSNFTTQRRRVRVARRPLSLRYQRHLPASSRPSPSSGAVLLEPNLGDFLALSDDDIAEEETDKEAPAEAKAKEGKPKSETSVAKTAKTAKAEAKRQKPLPPPPPQPKMAAIPSSAPATTTPVSLPAPTTPTTPTTPAHRKLSEGSPAPPVSAAPVVPAPPLTPLGTRPRTPIGHVRMAAAFEMARIASKHNFDLAYIARIWPKQRSVGRSSACHKSQPSSASSYSCNSASSLCSNASASTASTGSLAVSAGRRPSTASSISTASSSSTSWTSCASSGSASPRLAAQFLAAYGLATVAAPYSLSAPMHAKILRAKDQWLSFHEPEAQAGEFFRGYGCAFANGADAADEADTGNGSNGLVFVAYQRRTDGKSGDAAGLPAADLDELRQAVAALVGRLAAVHCQPEQQVPVQQPAKAAAAAPSAGSGVQGRGHHDAMCTLRRSRFLGVRATA